MTGSIGEVSHHRPYFLASHVGTTLKTSQRKGARAETIR